MRKEGMEAKLEMFGKNEMRIPPPRFLDLFKSQLLAPIAIFQVHTAHTYVHTYIRTYTHARCTLLPLPRATAVLNYSVLLIPPSSLNPIPLSLSLHLSLSLPLSLSIYVYIVHTY